jgi:TRAP transporter 4TM/12TM fusion protein
MTDEGRRDPESDQPRSAFAGSLEQMPDELPDELKQELRIEVEQLEQTGFAEAAQGARTDLRTVWRWSVFAVGLFLALYHLYTAMYGTLPSLQHRTIHLTLGLSLVFLLYPAKTTHTRRQATSGWVLTGIAVVTVLLMIQSGSAGMHTALPALAIVVLVQASRHLRVSLWGLPIADVAFAVLALGVGAYVLRFGDGIIRRAGIHNEIDIAVGAVAVLLVLVATQRVIGTPLVVVASTMLLYAYFGQAMPGFLAHGGYSVNRIVSTSMLGTEAILGTPIDVSSRFIFLFMIFAAMLQRTGMERFFTQLAFGITGGMVGGTAKVGVLTSAFSGTITGSSVANTVSNGAFTIPMMKKAGYKGEFAGAVEAASSTGGQLAPPIMGAAAFIMIEFIETSYLEIIKAAAIPALLFFTAQFIVIHYESKRLGIMGLPRDQLPNVRRLMMRKGYLLVPIVVIFVLLAQGRSVTRAALMAVFATVVVNVVVQVIAALFGRWNQLEDRLTPVSLLNGLVDAARIALPIISACAAAGMIAGVITLTGIGLQLTDALLTLSGETLILTMFFSMIACLILGIGVPTTANYVITATLVAPAIVMASSVDTPQFASIIAAHMFVYYFGIMADITPPVCLASYAAAGIARANPLRTGVQSFRIAISGFLVPYMFVLTPQLLLQDVTWFTGTKAAVTALVGVYAVGTAVVGFIDRGIPWPVRVVLLGSGLMLLVADLTTDLIGLTIFLSVLGWQWWTGPRSRRTVPVGTPAA